jgi:predicted transcriptional regulator
VKTLTFEVSDALYEAFQQMAAKHGRTLEEVALEWLAQHTPRSRPQLTEEERQEALERLLRHAGTAHLGYPTGTDNEQIDADLAHEYGGTHEEA